MGNLGLPGFLFADLSGTMAAPAKALGRLATGPACTNLLSVEIEPAGLPGRTPPDPF
jgi:hypothetical protein